jgi:hypothetical protein
MMRKRSMTHYTCIQLKKRVGEWGVGDQDTE